eukprot:g21775.t1
MPVPTDMPSPTSPADGADFDVPLHVEELSIHSTETEQGEDVPVLKPPTLGFGVVPTLPPPASAEVQAERSVDSAQLVESALPMEPDMPVPTDVPSPTSPADAFAEDEAPVGEPPLAAPRAPMEEKPPEADFPPPMPESAPMSASASEATSPEPPVPVEEARSAPISGRMASAPMSSAVPGTATPSEGVRVPTDLPSPTSLARAEGGPAAEVDLPEPESAPLVSAGALKAMCLRRVVRGA